MSYEFYIYRDEDMFEKSYVSIQNDVINYVSEKEDACLFRIGVLDKKNENNENYIYYKTKKSFKEYFITIENDSLEVYELNNSMLEAKSDSQREIIFLTTKEYTVKNLPNLDNNSVLFEAKDNLYPPVRYEEGMYKIELTENFYYFFEDNTDNDGLFPDIVELSLDKIFDLYNDLYNVGSFDYLNQNFTIFRTKAKVNFQDYYNLDLDTPIINIYGFGDPFSSRYLAEKLMAQKQVADIYDAIEEKNKIEEVRFVFNQTKFDDKSQMLKKSISYFYFPINETQPKLVDYEYEDFIGYYAMPVLTSSLIQPPVEPPVEPPVNNDDDDFVSPPENTSNNEPNNEVVTPIEVNDDDDNFFDESNNDNFEEESIFPSIDDNVEEIEEYDIEEEEEEEENNNEFLEPYDDPIEDKYRNAEKEKTDEASENIPNEVYYEDASTHDTHHYHHTHDDTSYEGTKPVSNICFVKDTMIQTDSGLKKIQDITTNDTIDNIEVTGITKTINNNINHLIQIKKNAFRKNVPSKDIIVTRSHKININGETKKAYDLLNIGNHKISKIPYNGEVLYNILLETYRFIKVQNVYMETLHPNNKIARLHKDVLWNNNIEQHVKESMVKKVNKISEDCSILNRTYSNINHEALRK